MEIYCLRSIGGYRAREKGLVNVSTNMRFVLLIWELRVFIANKMGFEKMCQSRIKNNNKLIK